MGLAVLLHYLRISQYRGQRFSFGVPWASQQGSWLKAAMTFLKVSATILCIGNPDEKEEISMHLKNGSCRQAIEMVAGVFPSQF